MTQAVIDQTLIQRIKDRFELDQHSAQRALTPQDVPIRYDLITREWLTAVLCGKYPDARVLSYELDKIDDGTSNRRRIFLSYNEAGERIGLPRSVFGKSSQGLHNRITYGVLGTGKTETTFYTALRPMIPIEAPQAYFASFDPESFNSIILLQDLAGRAEFCTHDTYIDFERAGDMVRLLATLHGTFYQRDALDVARGLLKTWPEHWNNVRRLGMEEYSNKGFLAAEDIIPPRLFKRYAEIWPATLRAVEQHRSLPQTVVHGDVHLKNWYITRAGRMGLSDWQGPCIAHWSRDFAYATSAALTIEDRRRWQVDLLRIYLDALRSQGVSTPSESEAMIMVRRQLFTALAYWTVTLRHPPSMPDMQPEDTTRAFIARIATAVDDLDALDSFG